MRRTIPLLATMALTLMVASGVALAATINCPNRAGILCVGTDNQDVMYGTSANDVMRGLDGSDTLRARAGSDRLSGGHNGDRLGGGRGSDVYVFDDDWGRGDRITKYERSGVDTLDFTRVDRGRVGVNLQSSEEKGDPEASVRQDPDGILAFLNFSPDRVENVRGSPMTDIVQGNDSSNHLWGNASYDFLRGNPGDDVIHGGAGPDDLFGDEGDDTIYARDGEQDASISCSIGNDTVYADEIDVVNEPFNDCETVIRP